MTRPKGYTASIRETGALWDNNKRGEWPLGTKKWTVTLKNPAGKTMSFQFHTGPAVSDKPDFNTVVQAAITDGLFYEDHPTLEEFARESGMDPENKGTAKSFEACKDLSERTRVFFGDDFDMICEATA